MTLGLGIASGDDSEFKVHVLLSNEGKHPSKVQICVDVNETFASKCRDTYVTNKDNVIVDGGSFTFTNTSAPKNSTVVVCFYSFRYENGDCQEIVNDNQEGNKSNSVLFRINYSPVFYDDGDMRLYRYGQVYMSKSGLRFTQEHESIATPHDTK